ncbi:MAG: efflux RND transporter permease subunit [Marinagarivorans sp.]|nr:efflux RND transporter permease subunit [Marinagarivorans sp.]
MNALIRWFIDNPIAANLLMLFLLIGGAMGAKTIEKEVFPSFAANRIDITMSYPGAASSEVEQQIVVRIEEAIADLPGIFQITSQSRQDYGVVNIAVVDGYDLRELLNDIKGRVDAINTFPTSAERPIIRQFTQRQILMWAALYGDVDRQTLKKIAYQIRDEMPLLEGISEVVISGLKNDELSIEISEENLRRYNLSFDEIATAIRQSSLNIPAGTIKASEGDIQIQTRAQAFNEGDFAKIVVRSQRDGGQLLLGDIADINDGFTEQDIIFNMNGKPGLNLEIKLSDEPKLIEGTNNARAYIDNLRTFLPPGLDIKINFEMRSLFDSRFNLLKNNALSGLLLVFIILMLFLRPLLAFWVVAGIATTFAGAIWLLPYFDVSLNMLSMFAFLMVLGIVVDDAIIIGESIYLQQQHGDRGKHSAFTGTRAMLNPVFLAVASTIAFFLPMIDVPEEILPYTRSIFYVVFLCLTFSLIESLLILPSHLSHMKPEQPSRFYLLQRLTAVRGWFSQHMENFAKHYYLPALKRTLQNKGSTYLVFFFTFAVAATLVTAGWIKSSFMPNVPQPFVMINLTFPEGTPFSQTQTTAQYIQQKIEELRRYPPLLAKNNGAEFVNEFNQNLNGTSATIFVGLTPPELRTISSDDVAEALRKLIGPLPEAQSYSLNSNMNGGGADIALNLSILNNKTDIQKAAVDDVTKVLAAYPGVINLRNNLEGERTEIELALKPNAHHLGLRLSDIAKQVRQSFYGEEIQRIPRGKEDVKVMLRYPAAARQTLDTLDNLRVRTQDGREIPLHTVADVKLVGGASTIRRADRKRNISITAEVEDGIDANAIIQEMQKNYSDSWKRSYTGFSLTLDGSLRAQARFGESFQTNFIKIFIVVLCFFAIAFRSVFQPFLIMLAVPFGFVGAVFGHLLLGQNISMMSFFGFLACAGVVVNDNLVLLERINQLRANGEDTLTAVTQAGIDRFRPILLTSITTFVGLLPILFERSVQAQFLIPMVISLSFGVLFSTVITLFLVPCCYLGGYRLQDFIQRQWQRLRVAIRAKLPPPKTRR